MIAIAWGAAAIWALQILQLWQAGEQEVELKTIEKALDVLKGQARGDVVEARYEGDAPIGSGAWIEEQEWLETEAAARGHCYHDHDEDEEWHL